MATKEKEIKKMERQICLSRELSATYSPNCIDQTIANDLYEIGFREQKQGKWIVKNNEKDWKDQNSYRVDIKCSECGKSHFLGTTNFANEFNPDRLNKLGTYADYTFCGRCGARMDGTPEERGGEK